MHPVTKENKPNRLFAKKVDEGLGSRNQSGLLSLDPLRPGILSEAETLPVTFHLVQTIIHYSFVQVHDHGHFFPVGILDLLPYRILSELEGLPAKVSVLARLPYPTDVIGEFVFLAVDVER